jgi:PKD repeat protein
MTDRVSSLDTGYKTGDLSIYPAAKDTTGQLYQVTNNAESTLSQSVSYNATYFIVNDASSFPPAGIVRVGTELIYYSTLSGNTFKDLKRGFSGSEQNQWPVGTTVGCSVAAETHNAIKDAVINIEANLGEEASPTATSLNGILKQLENRFLAPKPVFRGSPLSGPAPLAVTFQNFSSGPAVRYLWDFGDGQTSTDTAPTHVYVSEGTYTVSLNMITSLNAQGEVTKKDYITIDNSLAEGYYYVSPTGGSVGATFTFVDQSKGSIASRYWIFDDGTTLAQPDPDVHTATHVYTAAGTYNTALIVVFGDQSLRRYTIDPIVVS